VEKLLMTLRRLVGDFPPLVLSLKMLLQGNRVTEADKARIIQGLKKVSDTVLMGINRENVEGRKVFEHFRFVLQ